MRSWAVYDKTVRQAIHSLKYKNNISLGYFFSQKIQSIITTQPWDFDIVIPVPLSKNHLKERGYNQSSLIGRPLSHLFGKSFLPDAIIRNRETKSQFELTAQERFENVKDAFLGNPAKLKGKGVLLVDDVITTGATMENCTKALLTAGASRVYCVSVARVPVSE
jgi:ComF family protein